MSPSPTGILVSFARDFGVEGRRRFYDQVGALRDVVQNHLFQVMALLAMDAPVSSQAEDLRDAKASVFRAIRLADPDELVRGQFDGYRVEPAWRPTPMWRPTSPCGFGSTPGGGQGSRGI